MEIVLRFKPMDTDTARNPPTVTMITYLEFDNVMEITKSRNILINYQ